jgi:hypothetical protein
MFIFIDFQGVFFLGWMENSREDTPDNHLDVEYSEEMLLPLCVVSL